MKKEEIITLIIIAIIIISNAVSQNYTRKCISEMDSRLSEIKNATLRKEKTNDELLNDLKDLYDDWEEKNESLSYYIEHDELEKVNTQIIATKGYYEADLEDDAVPELEKGIYILEHIKEKQSFNLKNIF